MTLKVLVKFDTKLLKTRNRAKKIRTRVLGDFLGPKVTTPQIWGSAEVSAVLGVFLKICSCQLFSKKILVTFYCCFFQFFSKNGQKVKVNNFAGNCQNHQILLETCSLRSLDTVWYILCYSIGFIIFCD